MGCGSNKGTLAKEPTPAQKSTLTSSQQARPPVPAPVAASAPRQEALQVEAAPVPLAAQALPCQDPEPEQKQTEAEAAIPDDEGPPSEPDEVQAQASKKRKKKRKNKESRAEKDLGAAATEDAVDAVAIAPRSKPPPRAASGTQWTGSKWMAALRLRLDSTSAARNLAVGGSSILEVLTAGLCEDSPAPPEATEFEALHSLASLPNLDEVLTNNLKRALPVLKEMLMDGLQHLTSPSTSTGKEFSAKYAGETFELSYGTLNRFFGGLESMVGRPEVPVLKAMYKEHCAKSDSDIDFTTSNYGVTSQSWKEFGFVFLGEVREKADLTWETVEEIAEKLENFDPEKDQDALTALPDPVKEEWLKLAGDIKELESQPYDAVSQKVPDTFLVLERFAEVHDRHARAELLRLEKRSSAPREDPATLKDPSQARQPFPLTHFCFEFWVMNKLLQLIKAPPLGVAEFVGVRLYTGPMFQKYNGVLRMFTGIQMMVDQWKRDCVDNKYTCTSHVINSALIKISKVQKAVKVFRGMSGGRLPTSFVEANAFGVKGGIEFGFMSSTTNRDVAATYAGSGRSGIVFEIQQGMIDRGASLGWASQYPHEKEICFGPLSGLQVVNERVDGNVLIVEVRLTVNMVSLTIEQVTAKRRTLIEDMCLNLKHEATETLKALEDDVPQFADFIRPLSARVQTLFGHFSQKKGDWYNTDEVFKAVVVGSIDLREAISHLEDVMKTDGKMSRADQVYKGLLPLNWLCEDDIEQFLDIDDPDDDEEEDGEGAGSSSDRAKARPEPPTELLLERLGEVPSELRERLEALRKDSIIASEINTLAGQKKTVEDMINKNERGQILVEEATKNLLNLAQHWPR